MTGVNDKIIFNVKINFNILKKMDDLRAIRDFNVLKTIADQRRLEILRLLMERSYSLTQLGKKMGLHPAKVRYHLKQLEEIGFVAFESSREVRGFVEKYYRATAKAFFINQVVLPQTGNQPMIVALGSHDPGLELLAAHFNQDKSTPDLVTIPIGSLDGLIALRQGLCHFAGCHLYDPGERDYNVSYIRHLFPDQPVHLITLAHRLQGFMVEPGNPCSVQGLQDLARENIIFINRSPGSGTRLWLDQELKDKQVPAESIRGYTNTVSTHSAVAEEILSGRANVGLGVMAAARKYHLGFVPMFEERFDLVILDETFQSDLLSPTFEYMQTALYRKGLEALGGYDPHDTGKEIEL
jgi:putative molybdopterin biosynthesis protein